MLGVNVNKEWEDEKIKTSIYFDIWNANTNASINVSLKVKNTPTLIKASDMNSRMPPTYSVGLKWTTPALSQIAAITLNANGDLDLSISL